MRRSLLIACTALFSLACARSCKDSAPEPVPQDTRSLSFPEEEISVPWAGGGFEIGVNANFEYRVSSDASWISEDGGSATLRKFKAEANEDIAPRSCKVRFTDVSDRYYFKEVTGKTLYEYITDLKLKEFAERLQDTDDQVIEIALSMGENDTKSISRRFKQIYGCTPIQWRARARNQKRT